MKPESEAAFQQTITNLATYLGWHWYHAPDNRPVRQASGRVRKQSVVPGFPDLTLIREPELIVAELKAENGRVSAEQSQWLARFAACGVETHVWRPSDWDLIRERLAQPYPAQVAA